MGFLAKAVGWAVAHKAALFSAWQVFKGLRGRRKETQLTGESMKDFYVRKLKEKISDAE